MERLSSRPRGQPRPNWVLEPYQVTLRLPPLHCLLPTCQPHILCCQDNGGNGAQPSRDMRLTLQRTGRLPTSRPSSQSNSTEHLSPYHTMKRNRPCAWNSSRSRHLTQPRPSTLTANRFLKRSKAALPTLPNGIVGDEEADTCAKQTAAIIDGTHRPVFFAAANALIPRTLTDPPPSHCRTKEVYTKTFSWPADCRAVSKRHDAVLLSRLRADHTPPPLFLR